MASATSIALPVSRAVYFFIIRASISVPPDEALLKNKIELPNEQRATAYASSSIGWFVKGRDSGMGRYSNNSRNSVNAIVPYIVFIPKYRKKQLYGRLREDVREVIKTLCQYKKVEIVEEPETPKKGCFKKSSELMIATISVASLAILILRKKK